MTVSLYIAKRYLYSKSSNNAINFITYIALTGVILGSASLFIVLSGFAGLKDFTLQFSSVVDPDLKAQTTVGKSFVLSKEQIAKLNALEDVAFYSKIIEERVVITSNDKNTLATIKGVDERYKQVVNTDTILEYGNWLDQKTNQIVVGWGISNSLSLGVLDFNNPLKIYVPKPGKGQITSAKNAFNTVDAINSGVFFINESLNDEFVYVSIDLAKNLLQYKPNQISSVEFKLKKEADVEATKTQIQAILGTNIVVKNRVQLNDALYKMLNTEYIVVYLIFTLVLIIAFFNVVGSLIMMILDKKKSLITLFNIGATLDNIRHIFFLQGSLMSVFGGIIGLFLGLLVLTLQRYFNLVMITESLAYPVTIKIENFFIVLVTISVLGIIASKIASSRITKSMLQT